MSPFYMDKEPSCVEQGLRLLAGSGALALDDFVVTSLLFGLDVFNLNESLKRESMQQTDIYWESKDLGLNLGSAREY